MTVTDMSRRYREAFYEAAATALSNVENGDRVQLVRGHPGAQQADDIVSLLDVQVEQDVANLSNTNRSRECEMRLTVRVATFRRGGLDQQEVVEARAYELLTALEEHVRVTDTTLGGVVRHCFCTSHIFDPLADLDVSKGRWADIDAVFTAKGRITSA